MSQAVKNAGQDVKDVSLAHTAVIPVLIVILDASHGLKNDLLLFEICTPFSKVEEKLPSLNIRLFRLNRYVSPRLVVFKKLAFAH